MPPAEGQKQDIRTRIERSKSLPTLPGSVARIVEMVDSADATGRQLSAEIARDQVLSARVLKLVNSGFYGFSQPIATIPHAVTMLGFDTVKSLVLSSSVLEMMDEALPGLWAHSLACGRASMFIAQHLGLPDAEELSVIGLLHDLGKVVLCQALAREFGRVREKIYREDILFFQAERELLGCHHGEIAGWLLEKWSLPPTLVAPIVDHHDFRQRLDCADRTAIVHLADILSRAEAFGSGGDRRIPRLDPLALDLLGMDVKDVQAVMGRMNDELTDIPRM